MRQEPIGKQCHTAIKIAEDTEILKLIFAEDVESEFIREAREIVHFLILYGLFTESDTNVFARCYEGIG